MASSAFSVARSCNSPSNVTKIRFGHHVKDEYYSILGKVNFSSKICKRNLILTNVASKVPALAPTPIVTPTMDQETVDEFESKLAAWTSIRQERWEGELDVQGQIPLWLVSFLQLLYILIINVQVGHDKTIT